MQPFSDIRLVKDIKVKSFLRIVILIILSVVGSTVAENRSMRCTDSMVVSEIATNEDAVFEEESYAHTLRTLDHLLREQKAEVACLSFLTNCESKVVFVSPPHTDVQRALLHQRLAISLLAADHPIRTRYITHSYYVYMLERILI